jgi:hypothetical protein
MSPFSLFLTAVLESGTLGIVVCSVGWDFFEKEFRAADA